MTESTGILVDHPAPGLQLLDLRQRVPFTHHEFTQVLRHGVVKPRAETALDLGRELRVQELERRLEQVRGHFLLDRKLNQT